MDRNWRIAAAYFTLAGDIIPFASSTPSPFDLRDRADAAARAGYIGLGLETSDLLHCIEHYGYAGIRQILRDAGLAYFELEVLFDWFADGDLRAASDRNRKLFLETACEIETAQIKVIGGPIASPYSISRMIDEFAILCQDAAAVGTAVNLEIYPDSNIRDLASAKAVIGGAAQPNGGLLIDLWHMGRGGIAYEDLLTLPKGMIRAIELDDASAVQVGSLFEDTIHRRLLPGEGDLDPQRLMRCVWEAGFDGVIGVEIVSAEQRARSLDDAARLSFEATRAQLDAAADSVSIAAASAD